MAKYAPYIRCGQTWSQLLINWLEVRVLSGSHKNPQPVGVLLFNTPIYGGVDFLALQIKCN